MGSGAAPGRIPHPIDTHTHTHTHTVSEMGSQLIRGGGGVLYTPHGTISVDTGHLSGIRGELAVGDGCRVLPVGLLTDRQKWTVPVGICTH